MNMIDDTGAKESSATRGAYLTLRDMILTGQLPAGQKLKIEQLRGILKTGASPVREKFLRCVARSKTLLCANPSPMHLLPGRNAWCCHIII